MFLSKEKNGLQFFLTLPYFKQSFLAFLRRMQRLHTNLKGKRIDGHVNIHLGL